MGSFAPQERGPSPWGPIQHVKERAPDLVRVSTSSHGGYWLSPERWAELHATLPGIVTWGNSGPQWLEEDSDWALAVLVWPALFEPEDRRNALRVVRYRDTDKAVIDAFLETSCGKAIIRDVAEFETSLAGKWETGCCMGGGGNPWISVELTQCGTNVRKVMGFAKWPTQQFYTDAELEEAAYKPAVEAVT